MQAGRTALYVSAGSGHVEVARLLLESKADIHAADTVPRSAPAPPWAAAASRALHRTPRGKHSHSRLARCSRLA